MTIPPPIADEENVFAVGEYPGIGLADASAIRADVRELVKHGIHPAHHRKACMAQGAIHRSKVEHHIRAPP